jgi:hypothetical protein
MSGTFEIQAAVVALGSSSVLQPLCPLGPVGGLKALQYTDSCAESFHLQFEEQVEKEESQQDGVFQ